MRVVAVEVPAFIEEKIVTGMIQHLSVEKRERITRFIREEDAYRSLIADVLARTLICQWSGRKNAELLFAQNPYGKPCLATATGLEYNVSHSGSWAVAAIHDSPVGIDIEAIRPIDIGISRRFFSHEEHNDLIAQGDSEFLAYFYRLWTAKESYIKFTGEGLSRPLDSFTVKVNQQQLYLKAEAGIPAASFWQYPIGPGYRLTVCAGAPQFPRAVEVMELGALIQAFSGCTGQGSQ